VGGGIVLAANAGPRVPSGGVTLKRRCTYRPSVIYLIANKLLSLSLSLLERETDKQKDRETEREGERGEREKDVCVCPAAGRQELTPPAPCVVAVSHEQAHEHARVLGSVAQLPLPTFNWSCLVSIHPCPMSMFTSSSSSFSSLSRGQEHQTQPPTPVTPIPILLSPPSPYSCHPYPLYQDTCITGI